MSEFIDKLLHSFHSPLSAILLVIGIALIFMGLTDGIPVNGEITLSTQENFECASLAIGILAVGLSIVVYYKPPIIMSHGGSHDRNTASQASETTQPLFSQIDAMAPELTMSWLQKRDFISGSQKKLLSFVETRNSVNYISLAQEFSDIANSELYYRLEQLRLLGFIVCHRMGNDANDVASIFFRPSEEYQKELNQWVNASNTLYVNS
ncbi:hypothetical protein [Sessilibacter sp. MAH4]